MKKQFLWHLLAILIFSSLGFLYIKKPSSNQADPDRYYHLALSRIMVENHTLVPDTLPQVEGLGWDQYFPDKEFLFHQLTRIGYLFGKDQGVIYIVSCLSLGCFILLYFLICNIVAPPIALLLILGILLNNYFLYRITLLRPHVLAIPLFILLLHGILSRNKWLCLIAMAMLVLSYHIILVPLALVGICACVYFIFQKQIRAEWKLLYYCIFGLLIGLFANPYFPSNLILGWEIMKIPFLIQNELADAGFGIELLPLSAPEFRNLFLIPTMVILLGIFSLTKRAKNLDKEINIVILVALAFFLFLLCIQIPRPAEYLIPVSLILAAYLFELWHQEYFKSVIGITTICLMYSSYTFIINISAPKLPPIHEPSEQIYVANNIPHSEDGTRVFNCDWSYAPYLLYARPDLHFIDILDPSLLYFKNKYLFQLKQSISRGEVPDLYAVMHDTFKAKYVVCRDSKVIEQMNLDPNFIKIYPRLNSSEKSTILNPEVYQLNENVPEAFTKNFQIALLLNTNINNFREKTPNDPKTNFLYRDLQKTSYLDLMQTLQDNENSKVRESDAYCALVKPDLENIKSLSQVDFLGIGGGRNIRIWLNGKSYYSSVNAFISAKRIQLFLPLPRKLTTKDKIEILSCSAKNAPYWGVSLSFWSKKMIDTVCENKLKFYDPSKIDHNSWSYLGTENSSCLGPILTIKNEVN